MPNALVQVLLVVVIGHVLYGVDWPADWLALVGSPSLGVVTFGALGIAFAHAIPNFDSAPGVRQRRVPAADLHLGRLLLVRLLPGVLEAVAEALPLKHVIDGLPAGIVGGGGDTLEAALVVALWTVAGLLLAVRYFRWS